MDRKRRKCEMHEGEWKVEKAAWLEGLKWRCHKNAEQGIQ